MQVRHNTSLLEQAVAHVVRQAEIPTLQAEAAAYKERERATGYKRLATGVAVAIAALGLGFGISALYPRFVEATDTPSIQLTAPSIEPLTSAIPSTVASSDVTEPSVSQASVPDGPTGAPTRDFTKFQRQDVNEFGRTWTIEAGHHFVSDTDQQWDFAWCYTKVLVSGVAVTVDLVNRAPTADRPNALIATRETLSRAGLSDDDAVLLATFCPWLDDKRFTTSDFSLDRKLLPDAKSNGPSSAVTSDELPPNQPKGAFVQFGSFASLIEADSTLPSIAAKWTSTLAGRKIFVQTVAFGQSDVRYNIRAQFETIDEARSVCASISNSGGACYAGAY